MMDTRDQTALQREFIAEHPLQNGTHSLKRLVAMIPRLQAAVFVVSGLWPVVHSMN